MSQPLDIDPLEDNSENEQTYDENEYAPPQPRIQIKQNSPGMSGAK